VRRLRRAGVAVLIVVGVLGIWAASVYSHIRTQAALDEAGPADAIIVLGAAQYNGRPSPVLRARLDHALDLFERGLANIVITTGSYGPDPNFSEAHVGARYLADEGVDSSQIITEQGGDTTYETVQAAARHMHSQGWTRAVIVSDGFHLYRLKRLFDDNGILALTSPAPASPIEATTANRVWYSLREVLLIAVYQIDRMTGRLLPV
jgi:uncharacterized SAM-binding protein YcdF (DUF218 family)